MGAKNYVLNKKRELEDYIPSTESIKDVSKLLGQFIVPLSKLDRMCLVAPFSDVDWEKKNGMFIIPASKLFLYGSLVYTLIK